MALESTKLYDKAEQIAYTKRVGDVVRSFKSLCEMECVDKVFNYRTRSHEYLLDSGELVLFPINESHKFTVII